MSLSTRAPAKINLSLHILGRRADGYHELESLVAFAGAGDRLTLEPGPDLALAMDGPTASAAGADADNLVLKAARALAERRPGLVLGRFTLLKRLPVAAGIGGGSADAAAALRLLAEANGLARDDARVFAAAAATGADVPVCLDPHARMMRGIGERIGPRLALPPLAAVLVNPGVKVETKTIFARIGLPLGERRPGEAHADVPPHGVLATLQGCRNDLQAAATLEAPVIDDVLALLGSTQGCRLARMSGSGATCFGIFDDCRGAARCAAAIRRQHPAWWVKSTILR